MVNNLFGGIRLSVIEPARNLCRDLNPVAQLTRANWIKVWDQMTTIPGYEKTTKVVLAFCDVGRHIPDFNLAGRVVAISAFFTSAGLKAILGPVDSLREFCYATMVLNGIGKFIKKDDTGKITFVLPNDNFWDNLREILLFIGNIFEVGKFLQKKCGVQFERCSAIASQLGGVEVYGGVRLFTYTPFHAWTDKPKEFFVFTACCIELATAASRYWFAEGTDRQIEDSRKKLLKTENMLKYIAALGKIGLIHFSRSAYGMWQYDLLNLTTQYASYASIPLSTYGK